jgi:DNA mismatch endonuclease (patch repair protein)
MDKRKANLERDARKISELIQLGWRVAVVWQCVLEKPEIFSYIMNNLERWIISNNTYFEIPNRIETTQNQ